MTMDVVYMFANGGLCVITLCQSVYRAMYDYDKFEYYAS